MDMNKFPKKEAIKFCELYGNEKGTHQSNRLKSCLRSKFYDKYSTDDILSQGHLMVLSVLCDIEKDYDTSFEINNFSKKNLKTFVIYMIMREPVSSTCGPIISSIRPFSILPWV